MSFVVYSVCHLIGIAGSGVWAATANLWNSDATRWRWREMTTTKRHLRFDANVARGGRYVAGDKISRIISLVALLSNVKTL